MGNSHSGKPHTLCRPSISVKVRRNNSGSVIVICPSCISPSSISVEVERGNTGSVSVIRSPCSSNPSFSENEVNQLVSNEMDQCAKSHHCYGSSVSVEVGENNSAPILVICPPCKSVSTVFLEVGRDNSGPISVICSQSSTLSVSLAAKNVNQLLSSQIVDSQCGKTHHCHNRSLIVTIGRNNSGSILVPPLPCSCPSALKHNVNHFVSSKIANV